MDMAPDVLAYTIQYPQTVKELIDTQILFSRYDPANTDPQQAGAKRFISVWDSGCTDVAITKHIAEELNLQPIDAIPTGTANGVRLSLVYELSLWLPNHIYLPKIRVTEVDLQGADCLIGMGVIKYGDLCISNYSGTTTLSFRVPSVGITDYYALQQKLNPVTHDKLGRNDPCPCGSGKKYKNCCAKK